MDDKPAALTVPEVCALIVLVVVFIMFLLWAFKQTGVW